mgnify:CR=1 FL=1
MNRRRRARDALFVAALAALAAGAIGCRGAADGADRAAAGAESGAPPELATAAAPSTTADPGAPPRTATGANGLPRDERLGPPGSGRPADDALQLGDCYIESLAGTNDQLIHETTVVGCRAPHDAEVFVRDEYPDDATGAFPGEREVERRALRVCLVEFATFVGRSYATSSLRVTVLRPAASSWVAGDRALVCSIYDPALAPLVGSVRGSQR